MVDDDDIPVLTKVVKRERRAEPPLSDTLRNAIIDDVVEQADKVLRNAVEAVAVDIDALLGERVTTLVMARLPELVEQAVERQLDLARKRPGDSD
ncbi:MAG: hypothetical protein AAF270_07450 [Pseudomonadota bacterium]